MRFTLFTKTALVCTTVLLLSACGQLESLQEFGQTNATAAENGQQTTAQNEDAFLLNNDGNSDTNCQNNRSERSEFDANTQAIVSQIKAVRTQIKAKVQAICPRDHDVKEAAKLALSAIDTTDKSCQEIRQARHEVKKEFRPQMKESRQAFKVCAEANKEALSPYRDLHKQLAEACGNREKRAHKRGHMHNRMRGQKGEYNERGNTEKQMQRDHDQTSDAGKAKKEEKHRQRSLKLQSDNCQTAITEVEAALQ